MRKRLAITLDSNMYDSLHHIIRKGKISKHIENLLKPLMKKTLQASYEEAARDEENEKDALEWIEGTVTNDFN